MKIVNYIFIILATNLVARPAPRVLYDPPKHHTIHAFTLSQSNTVGLNAPVPGNVTDDSYDSSIPLYMLAGSWPTPHTYPADGRPPIGGDTGQSWSTFADQAETRAGPERGYGRRLREIGDAGAVIFKVAINGRDMDSHWMKGNAASTAGGNLWDLMADELRTARSALEIGGNTTEVVALLLCRYAGDSNDETRALSYQQNLTTALADFRADHGTANTRCVVIRGPSFNNYEFLEITRAAVVDFAKADPLVEWIDTDDTTDRSDNLHFDQSSLEIIGRRMCDALY